LAPESSRNKRCSIFLEFPEASAVIAEARRASFEFLCKIELGAVFSDDALNSRQMAQLEERDRRLSTEIVYGTLRWQALLDYELAQLCSRPYAELEARAKILLRMSAYQLKFMDRVPNHAVVFDAVELAKKLLKRRNDAFINGVLRRLIREGAREKPDIRKAVPPWIQVSLPEWLWKRWFLRYGAETAWKYALSLNQPSKSALWLSLPLDPSDTLFKNIVASDIVPGAFRWAGEKTGQCKQSRAGIHLQDEASILIPMLFGDVLGSLVWDVCAAPGGKTSILCRRTGEGGLVVASDRNWNRLKRLVQTLKDYGCTNYRAVSLDASQAPPWRAAYDAVMADVPCSGLGTLRRNPEIKWRFSPENLPGLQRTQLRILECAAGAVKVGGKLLYSTCSTEPEENEDVVKAFMKSHPNFETVAPSFPPGIESWLGPDSLVRTYPGTHAWDGFFAALMVRNK
jgi:16S rRNA (cytosine967-C5)-methyltransferase